MFSVKTSLKRCLITQLCLTKGLFTVLAMVSQFSQLAVRHRLQLWFSLVLMIGDVFWAFGTVNKGLEWQYVTINPGTNMSLLACRLNISAVFSNI